MLEATWESVATRLANYKENEIPTPLDLIVEQISIPESDSLVMVESDTRLSSPALATACVAEIVAAGGRAQDITYIL